MLPNNTTVMYTNNYNKDCIMLMCNAPILPNHAACSLLLTSTSIPIHVCLLENNVIIRFWFVGQFTYTSNHYPCYQPSSFLEYQHQLQQQYMMTMGGSAGEAKEENNLSSNNSMNSTSQTTSLRLLTQPWTPYSNIAISSSPPQDNDLFFSSFYNSFDHLVPTTITENKDKSGNDSREGKALDEPKKIVLI